MKKYLFIAEKPSLMREVKKTYDKHKSEVNSKVGLIDFTALSGHVCRYILPNEYEEWNVKWVDIDLPMIPKTFKIDAISDKKKMVSDIKKQIKDGNYDGIIVGTDSDVEGNGIYYLLETHLGIGKTNALRFFENDLTDKALLESLLTMTDFHKNPRDVHMTEAFEIRSKMDWLIGMNFSVGFSVKSGFTMKVGRVKVPTLKLVYDNSKAIDEFVPHTDFELKAKYVEGFDGVLLPMKEEKAEDSKNTFRFKTEKEALDFVKKLGKIGKIKSLDKKKVNTKAPQLYKLSDIQVEAGSEFGYSPSKTLELLQSLYENHKLLSYPRTDGRYISSEKTKDFPDMLKAIESIPTLSPFVKSLTSKDYDKVKSDKRIVNDVEVKKASHDALLPTGVIPQISKLSKDETNILMMVYKRLLALFLQDLVEEKTVLITDIDGYDFKTNGKVVLEKGWTEIYNKKLTDNELPILKVGDTLTVKNYEPVAKTTTPPKRLTQATLIEAMENIAKYIEDKELKTIMKDVKGIGMPSSRGKIIDDLIKAGYMIDKKSGGLYISESGKKYIENIQDFSVCKPELTAVWETKMQEIKEGSRSYDDTENEMIAFVKETVDEIQTKEIKKSPWNISKNETGSNCPLCGGKMLKSKYGWFCGNRKENGCLFSIPDEIAEKKITDAVKRQIIENGISKEIKGFINKEGKEFPAKLKWDNDRKKVVYAFDEPEKMKKKHICPNCGKEIKDDRFNYICDCGLKISKKIAEKMIDETILDDILKNGKSKLINDFISKKGSKFPAYLVLDGNGVKFEFPPRK